MTVYCTVQLRQEKWQRDLLTSARATTIRKSQDATTGCCFDSYNSRSVGPTSEQPEAKSSTGVLLPRLRRPVGSTCQRVFSFDQTSTYGDGPGFGRFPPCSGRLVQN